MEKDFVTSAIADELSKGYMIGPFTKDTCPFPIYRLNGIGVVHGKYSGKKRLILDLSGPHGNPEHDSLNSLICKEDYSLSYVRIDDAIAIIKRLGKGCYMNKLDIRDAFKNLPIHPRLWHLHGLEWNGYMYFYTRLVFGCRSSPKLFTQLSQAVHYIATHNYGISHLLFLLDDFLSIDSSKINAERSMAILTMIFNSLNIPLSHHKTAGPATTIDYLGITLDSTSMEARLPPDKLKRNRDFLAVFKTKDNCTKRELLSLLGHLNYAARVVPAGRTFVARLLQAANAVACLWHTVTITTQCKEDVDMWLCLLKHWNGISLFLDSEFTDARDLQIYTSFGRHGFGGYNARTGQYFYGAWNSHVPDFVFEQCSTALLELYPLVVCGHLWGTQWARKRIRFHCDRATTCILNKRRSACPLQMKLLRKLTIIATVCNFSYHAERQFTNKNDMATDALSKGLLSTFQELVPSAAPAPQATPQLLCD